MRFKCISLLVLLCASMTIAPVFGRPQSEGSAPGTIKLKTNQAEAAYAQEASKGKGSFEVHLGAIHPGGDLKESYSNAFAFGFVAGYRIRRYFQFDAGLDLGFRAAGISGRIGTAGDSHSVIDMEVFVPLGGRLLIPVAKARAVISVGGGYAFLWYGETAMGHYTYDGFGGHSEYVPCPSCSSRYGHSVYELAQLMYFIDKERKYGIGVTARFFQGATKGEPVGLMPSPKTTDRWINLAGTLLLRF